MGLQPVASNVVDATFRQKLGEAEKLHEMKLLSILSCPFSSSSLELQLTKSNSSEISNERNFGPEKLLFDYVRKRVRGNKVRKHGRRGKVRSRKRKKGG